MQNNNYTIKTNIFSKKLLTKKKCSYIIISINEQTFQKEMIIYENKNSKQKEIY